ncbi:phenylalanine--tRNA ligase alpha subunit [Companilactobacillus sp. RD055328]|uniref:phenylalanine--tRNA ligase subunit alpha n=1 Tax=Companilactobacillus sp. RD055328 TaxID=2916634 RepID=UPI001FC7EE14|nr:phenylalanine--tRNA ligase subunit alpha [Companilactobacillus sp. RD055328]GKQ42528.1 phenylalanine--tRNA ligase alpha subunit [Companilactobacillus sp. RD055328]
MSLKENLEKLRDNGLQDIANSNEEQVLNDIRVKLLGKKGPITDALKSMKDLSAEERPKIGAIANQIKKELTEAIAKRQVELVQLVIQEKVKKETIDVTLPSRQTKKTGTQHILNQIIEDIEDLFIGLGYQVISGPEVEEDKYNFEKMNIPKDHPARDMQDTFYIDDELLMRTHTSPQQARTMEQHDFSKGPLKMISPGKVYRRDTDDATHSHQFHQIEGLVVDENITMADLKGTLEVLVRHVFGEDRKIRFRPSYFPFTEPSVEVDITCFACGGDGCRICKQTGWIEVLGAGLVHPNVLRNSGIDPEVYSGFAFGVGPDRFAMLKYGVEDIRNFYSNDVRFLEQFKGEEA